LDGAVKDDDKAEHIVRSSILKLLRDDESGCADSSSQRAAEASLGGALDDILALRPKAPGSPLRFKA
jgi:hypothetical protein